MSPWTQADYDRALGLLLLFIVLDVVGGLTALVILALTC